MHQSKITGKLPKKEELNHVIGSFSKKEKIFFTFLSLALLISTLGILQIINKSFLVEVPESGGSISEGIIGFPRFINPVLANSPADLDLTTLIYSGLMRRSPDGNFIPDLAEKYEVSTNGLVYTFTLKDEIYFQDGKPVTADDVIFTINKVQDSVIKSPREVEWSGVTAKKLDEKTVEFTLKQPHPSFLEHATIGIMPMYLWQNSPIELNENNTNPIGSGPYMIKNVAKEPTGIITSYELVPFKKFILGEPYIQELNLRFYSSEEDSIQALSKGEVEEISSITPLNASILKERNYKVDSATLPRVFGLFFNQNENQLFTDKVITHAINDAIDKNKIIREVLYGYGVEINGPIPPSIILTPRNDSSKNLAREEVLKSVESSLAKDGWVKNAEGFLEKTTTDKNKKKTVVPLAFSISTGNAPELAKTAELIKEDLEEIGMKIDIKTFEVGNLNQGVIRPRKYDALLFGQIINHESDLSAFWHSSQRKDPGLNVALYTNAKVDKILEDAFATMDEAARIKKYAQFEEEVRKDIPAVFLYSPNFIYVVSSNLKGLSMGRIISPRDRFLNVYHWYTETENVWKIFTPTQSRGSDQSVGAN